MKIYSHLVSDRTDKVPLDQTRKLGDVGLDLALKNHNLGRLYIQKNEPVYFRQGLEEVSRGVRSRRSFRLELKTSLRVC